MSKKLKKLKKRELTVGEQRAQQLRRIHILVMQHEMSIQRLTAMVGHAMMATNTILQTLVEKGLVTRKELEIQNKRVEEQMKKIKEKEDKPKSPESEAPKEELRLKL